MKKYILALAAVCALSVCFAGCDRRQEEQKQGQDTDETAAFYQNLNDLLAESYSHIDLTVTDAAEEITLSSVYHIDYTEEGAVVTYSVERLAEISLDRVPSSPIDTLEGKAEIADGQVTVVEGDDAGLPAAVAETSLSFQEEYFENIKSSEMYLIADVKNVAGFMGQELTCTGMHVRVVFFPSLSEIGISYTSAKGNRVTIQYSFTK